MVEHSWEKIAGVHRCRHCHKIKESVTTALGCRAPKWKPKVGQKYWWVSPEGWILWSSRFRQNDATYEFGNCFKTKKEAQRIRTLVRKALRG